MDKKVDEYTDDKIAKTLEEVLNSLESQNLITKEERKTIEETGKVTIGSRTIVFKDDNIVDNIKIGDYIDYDPTKLDAKREIPVENSKLTYTSPTGRIPTQETELITHGNGYTSQETDGGQTFTAKSSSELKWKVLNVANDKIELISETSIKKDNIDQDEGNFVLQGGIGYLFAEQELHEICKIYGYGYGAEASAGGTYVVGGPDEPLNMQKIEGTGARSITVEDFNKIVGYYLDTETGKMVNKQGNPINSEYGNTENPMVEVYYPTINSTNTDSPGQSNGKKKGLKNTYYGLKKEKIENIELQDLLFNGDYWLASRYIVTSENTADFRIRYTNTLDSQLSAYRVAGGTESKLSNRQCTNLQVRPIVTIKTSLIDIKNPLKTETGKIIWKLK